MTMNTRNQLTKRSRLEVYCSGMKALAIISTVVFILFLWHNYDMKAALQGIYIVMAAVLWIQVTAMSRRARIKREEEEEVRLAAQAKKARMNMIRIIREAK